MATGSSIRICTVRLINRAISKATTPEVLTVVRSALSGIGVKLRREKGQRTRSTTAIGWHSETELTVAICPNWHLQPRNMQPRKGNKHDFRRSNRNLQERVHS